MVHHSAVNELITNDFRSVHMDGTIIHGVLSINIQLLHLDKREAFIHKHLQVRLRKAQINNEATTTFLSASSTQNKKSTLLEKASISVCVCVDNVNDRLHD